MEKIKKIYKSRIYYRTIKNENKVGGNYVNPLTLKIETQKFISPDMIKTNNKMWVPPIGINSQNILEIYNIETINDFENIIAEINENGYTYLVNIIINSWIRKNFETLKKSHAILVKIYTKILLNFVIIENIVKNKNLDLSKEIDKFIKKWLEEKKETNFNLDLRNDLINYIQNK
jgi:hypothetical protein